MNIQKIISELSQDTQKSLKDRLANVDRLLLRDPKHSSALELKSAIDAEFVRRKIAGRKKIGLLWWEPRDRGFPTTHAYETKDSVVPVATIFKNNTHTATRKDVYSVRVGEHELPELFSEVEVARQAGSEAWEQH